MKRVMLTAFVCIILVFTAGCLDIFDFSSPAITPKPVYEMEVTEEDGMKITIAGVTFKELPKTKWSMLPDGKVDIGYAGSKDVSISAAQGDVIRNFIYVYTDRFDGGKYLYRTDITVPEPSGESVDEINFGEKDFSKDIGETIVSYKFTYDKQIIKEYFDELENADTVYSGDEVSGFGKTFFEVTCSSEKVPGAYYSLNLGHLNGKIVCGNNVYGYVEISQDLIEKLAGYKIDFGKLMRDSQ